ncbi:MAG TPA: hypothetical protein PLG70_09450, partial [Ottowia sp.]|nr:hypothetical protein [Ottowia sp.]
MSVPHWCRSHPALAGLAAACLLSACASVDLGRRYDPPPIRAPQPLPPAQLPSVPSNGVQTQPVTPAQPVPQPLPPAGQSAPPPVAPADPGAHLVTLTTRLDGASVMPPTRSAGSAQLDAVYDPATRLLRWKTRWSGLSGA